MRHKLPLARAEAIRFRAYVFDRAIRSASNSRLLDFFETSPEGIWGFDGMRRCLADLKDTFINNPHFCGLFKLLQRDLQEIERAKIEELGEYEAILRGLVDELLLAYRTTLRELASALPALVKNDPIMDQMINPDPNLIPAMQACQQQFEPTLARIFSLVRTLIDRTHRATMKFMTLSVADDCHVCPDTRRARSEGDTKDMIDYVIEARRANPNRNHGEVYEIAKKKFHRCFSDTFLSRNYVLNEWRTLVGF